MSLKFVDSLLACLWHLPVESDSDLTAWLIVQLPTAPVTREFNSAWLDWRLLLRAETAGAEPLVCP